jgi:hypothetical protein
LLKLLVASTTFTLCITDYLREYSLSKQSLEEQKNKLLQKDWLTSGLIHEIYVLLPTCSEIKIDYDNKRDSTAFKHKISQLLLLDVTLLASSNLTKPHICS